MNEHELASIIGSNIFICMKLSGMTIIGYARAIGVSRSTAKTYLNGTAIMNAHRLYLTAQTFKKPIEWFMEESHEKRL